MNAGNTSHLDIQCSVPFSAPLFEETLEGIVGDIAFQSGPWRDFPFT